MKVGMLCLVHSDPDALAVLPHVASFARNAVCAIVNVAVHATLAIEYPILFVVGFQKTFLASVNYLSELPA